MNDMILKTKLHRNFGADGWDGEGDCPQDWDDIGEIEEYLITDVPNGTNISALAHAASAHFKCEWSDDYRHQYATHCLAIERGSCQLDRRVGFSELVPVIAELRKLEQEAVALWPNPKPVD